MGVALAVPSVPSTLVGFALAGLGVATLIPAVYAASDAVPGLPHGARVGWRADGYRSAAALAPSPTASSRGRRHAPPRVAGGRGSPRCWAEPAGAHVGGRGVADLTLPHPAARPATGEDRRVTTEPPHRDRPWGIDATWLDAFDEEHEVAAGDHRPAARADRHPPADLEERAPIVARPGDALEVDAAEVVCEDGEVRGRRRRAARRTSRSATTGCARRRPGAPADRLPRPVLAARGPHAGAGRCSSTPPAAPAAGASATSPTCARSARWRRRRAPASC